jgi:hypothetical protein
MHLKLLIGVVVSFFYVTDENDEIFVFSIHFLPSLTFSFNTRGFINLELLHSKGRLSGVPTNIRLGVISSH